MNVANVDDPGGAWTQYPRPPHLTVQSTCSWDQSLLRTEPGITGSAAGMQPRSDIPAKVVINTAPNTHTHLPLRSQHDDRFSIQEEASIAVGTFPAINTIREWQLALRKAVAAASGRPQAAMQWIKAVWQIDVTLEALEDPGAFETLDAKLASALLAILPIELQRKVEVMEEQAHLRARTVAGRQVVFLIIKHLAISKNDSYLVDLQDLQRVHLKNNDVADFIHRWLYQLSGMDPNKVPPEYVLEDMIAKELRKADCMKEAFSNYDWEVRQEGRAKNYHTLLQIAKNEIAYAQKTRQNNFLITGVKRNLM